FDAIHWNAARGSYLDFDAVAAAPIDVQSAAAPAALAGGLITHDRAAALWRAYREACRPGRLVCTVPPGAPEFEPARYWRGPVWLSVNWLVIRGLRGTGLHADADAVVGESLELVERHGFREYFDALSGAGRGIDGFTWTAA